MANCLSDDGYTDGEKIRSDAVANAALARQVASAAIAIDNANRLIENYRDQRDISQRTIDIARQQQQQLETVYWPREEQFLAEFSNPDPIEPVEVMGARYAGRLVASVAAAFAKELHSVRCSARRYCTSANQKRLQDLMLARGTAMANARVLGRNIAFAEFQARTDINLSRRMQAVAIGRGLIAQAMSLYAAAGAGFANAEADISRSLNSAFADFGAYGEIRRNARQQRRGFDTPDTTEVRMPGTVDSGWNGAALPGMTANFGFRSSVDGFQNLDASNLMKGDEAGLSSTSQPNVFQNMQSEQMNNGKVGNNDLARTGVKVFPVIGGPGTVRIDMDLFPLKYVDDRTEGDSGII
jgi:hypothetical protein